MLRSVSVENYRSFADRATIELRPITILLGRNSAGKSSLTRLFPLLRQSMERGTSAPILWNSASVDFGRISDVTNRNHPDRPIQLTFELTDVSLATLGHHFPPYFREHEKNPGLESSNLQFTAFLRADSDGKTRYDSFELKIDNDHLRLDFSKNTIFLNGKLFDKKSYWSKIVTNKARLFPYFLFEGSSDDNRLTEIPNTRVEISRLLKKFVNIPDDDQPMSKNHMALKHPAIDFKRPYSMTLVARKNIEQFLKMEKNFIGIKKEDRQDLNNLADLLLITHFSQIVESMGNEITQAMQSLSYLGPVRASGNRFYREQELSVEKIDDTGENLATYLGSLSRGELANFNKILFNSFGVEVRPNSNAGHLSIEIGRPGDKKFDNLADVGFGYSQVLPLVAQIHNESRRRYSPQRPSENRVQISAVEQPELHLHPAYQANLADLFVAAIGEARHRRNIPIIILETHSEALIGRIGELISIGQLKPSDVAVHFVDKDENSGQSTVKIAEYDEDGMIFDWPIGFFSAR